MATTYTAQNAYDDAVAYSMNISIGSAAQIRLVDMIHSEIWTAFPWDWTTANLTAISLADGTQDYAISGSDGNFRKLTKVLLRRTDTSPDEYWGPLAIRKWLPPELQVKLTLRHRAIAYVRTGGNLRLRLEYNVGLGTGVAVQIEGEYQKNPTKITSLSTTFNFPDEFYNVIVNGLIYYIYRWSGDRRAGEMRIDRAGQRLYTGAMATYKDALYHMTDSYDVDDQIQVPEEPLGAGGIMAPGLFL
jgi:hypothetical protein